MKTLEFKNYDLKITLTPFINIVGTIGSGKTKLLKTLINKLNSNAIYLDEKPIATYDIDFLRKNIAAVLQTHEFKTNYVKEELLYYQKIINISDEAAYKNIENFVKFFNLENIIESKIDYLTIYEKAYIKILSLLIIRPSIFGIDDMLTYLNLDQKILEQIIKERDERLKARAKRS